ncbi:MAG TPA: 6-carboxytetrahydropterin synthase QueD [Blastocatellia bacterium]|nr:6-carboxytetrahydropterin synthase QueD [Blastocatellia bacterium]
MHEVMIQMSFSSAHLIRGHKGKCANLHGHNYRVEVYARGRQLDGIGMLIDFAHLRAATRKVVDYLDHKNINELPPFDREINPTAEEMAAYFLHEIGRQVNDDCVQVYKVRLWETENSAATYEPD